MAARANRPRPGPSREDPAAAQEETSMWNQIVADLKICKGIKEKASELVKQVIELERIMGKSTLPMRGVVSSSSKPAADLFDAPPSYETVTVFKQFLLASF